MIAFVFPGQGSQYIGMGKSFFNTYPEVKKIFEKAEKVTGIPVKKLCFEGPSEELTRTENLQVCITAVDIACLTAMRKEIGIEPAFVAGHSLGEYPALFAGGVLNLEDVFLAVKERGRLMEKAGEKGNSTMYAIINMQLEELQSFVKDYSESVVIANYNSPKQFVISGKIPEVDEVAKICREKGARVVKLRVSAGFHSPLMKEAEVEFSKILENLNWYDAKIPFVSNVSAKEETSGGRIKELMKKQITSSVKWIDCVNYMFEKGIKTFVEIGPKKVLSGLIKQILSDKEVKILNVEDEDSMKILEKELRV